MAICGYKTYKPNGLIHIVLCNVWNWYEIVMARHYNKRIEPWTLPAYLSTVKLTLLFWIVWTDTTFQSAEMFYMSMGL